MHTYLAFVLYLGLAEALRQCILIVILGITGPLSKIPGPFISKFTRLPWAFEAIRGNHINSAKQLFQKYGDIVRVAPQVVLVAEKAGMHKILVEEDLVKAPFFDNIRLHPGNSMLVTERDKVSHKQTRRLLSHGFSINYLNGLEPPMQECVGEFETFLNSKCEKSNGSAVIDMQGTLSNLAFDVMSATFLGGSFNVISTNNAKLKNTFVSTLRRAAINGQFPFLRYLPFWPEPVSPELNQILDNVISKREASGEPAKRDLVKIILDANQEDPLGFPDMRMRDEITMFMVAGSETTSASTTAILLLLVNNQEKLSHLVKEIDSEFPSIDDNITFAKLQELPYLNAVIWEGLRLMAMPANLLRYTNESIIIGGYEMPPKTILQPWPSALMHDPRIWPDAESFIPERWLGSYKGVQADRNDILAFSAGSRNCIGWQFAMREMRLVLARLIRRYDISLVEGQRTERRFHFTSVFVQGFYNVRVKPRR